MRRFLLIFICLSSTPLFATCERELERQLTTAKQTLIERRELAALIGMRQRGEPSEITALCERLDDELARLERGEDREMDVSVLLRRAECSGDIVRHRTAMNLRARSLLDHPAFGVEFR